MGGDSKAKRIRLGILFGGRSCEHEVSVASALSVLAAIDRGKYDVTLVGITKEGGWFTAGEPQRLIDSGVVTGAGLDPVRLDYPGTGALVRLAGADPGTPPARALDVVFPLLHGPFGEDGTIQGLLELAGLAYVGAGVAGSAVGMDKELMKRAFRAEELPVLDYRVVREPGWKAGSGAVLGELEAVLPYPVFVKPARLGSSVGISRAADRGALREGIDHALVYDDKALVEASAPAGHEVECAVLGNEHPRASVAGEIIPANAFYDYDAKYADERSEVVIPAPIPAPAEDRVRALSLRAFRAVEGCGLARVDFFVGHGGEPVLVNEINTMPGFTSISMYPKLWAASGVSYPALIDRLVELALERHAARRRIRTAL